MSRTVTDAFNQYHNEYVKPNMDSKAPKESPEFSGVPSAPTADNDTDSEQIATTEFCQNLIRRLVGAAPETLNTLVELAVAINRDPNFAQTIIQALDNKLNKTDAANIYLSKTDANTTYAKKTDLQSIDTSQFVRQNTTGTITGTYSGSNGITLMARDTSKTNTYTEFHLLESGGECTLSIVNANFDLVAMDMRIYAHGNINLLGDSLTFNNKRVLTE